IDNPLLTTAEKVNEIKTLIGGSVSDEAEIEQLLAIHNYMIVNNNINVDRLHDNFSYAVDYTQPDIESETVEGKNLIRIEYELDQATKALKSARDYKTRRTRELGVQSKTGLEDTIRDLENKLSIATHEVSEQEANVKLIKEQIKEERKQIFNTLVEENPELYDAFMEA